MAPPRFRRPAGYRPLFFWFCLFALAWATLLLFAGGFTTSIRAGMAFLDWPLSDGSVNPAGWLEERDKLAEHSHRLLGMKVGLLAIVLALWTWLREERAWVRTLARVLLLVVILQGVMGGARVRFDQLNTLAESNLVAQSFAVAHACGAQAVVLLLVSLTLASSRCWAGGAPAPAVPAPVRRLGLVATAAVFLQILLGAVMRHAEAGLAIAKFPLARQGSLLPAHWDFGVTVHFAHRAGAVVVTVLLSLYLARLLARAQIRRRLAWPCAALPALLVAQVYLGALTIWTVKNPHVATLHMLTGAFLLATVWGLTFVTYRGVISPTTGSNNIR
jgi:cytochrome c oxidase assembly protein subunit 15